MKKYISVIFAVLLLVACGKGAKENVRVSEVTSEKQETGHEKNLLSGLKYTETNSYLRKLFKIKQIGKYNIHNCAEKGIENDKEAMKKKFDLEDVRDSKYWDLDNVKSYDINNKTYYIAKYQRNQQIFKEESRKPIWELNTSHVYNGYYALKPGGKYNDIIVVTENDAGGVGVKVLFLDKGKVKESKEFSLHVPKMYLVDLDEDGVKELVFAQWYMDENKTITEVTVYKISGAELKKVAEYKE